MNRSAPWIRFALVSSAILAAGCGVGTGATGGDCVDGCAANETCDTVTGLCNAAVADAGASTCTASADTWSGYAAGFFSSNCSSCHGSAFSSAGAVSSSAASIQASISAGRMPRGGGLASADRTRIVKWLSCL